MEIFIFSCEKVENTLISIALILKKAVYQCLFKCIHFRTIQSLSIRIPFIQVFDNSSQLFLLSPFTTLKNQHQSSKNNVMAMLSFVSPLAVASIVYLVIFRQFSS